jgi:LmbE family N-acetylglucosaminyl deacetylase
MGTLVAFHAHPDDESLIMGGSLARAAAEGHRVVVVVATNGDHGEQPADLAEGESLADRRRAETQRSCDALGVHRLAWLGYADSGMTGWEQNGHPDAFINADPEVAAAALAAILAEERADVFVTYDWHGNYGHPDHLMVHRVGHRAAQIAGVADVFEVTMNRDHFRRLMTMATEHPELVSGNEGFTDFDPDSPADDGNPMGEPESVISHRVDVTAFSKQKLAAIAAHASQISDTSYFTSMDPAIFDMAFGLEWFVKVGESGPPRDGWLFA